MNLNIKIFLLCPIPDDQKPINEYINLRKNSFSNLLTLEKTKYGKKILSIFFTFFCLTGLLTFPFSETSVDQELLPWFLTNCFTSACLLYISFWVLFARWKQLENKLSASRLFYEEASWYDGQLWEKPFSIIKNDRLLASQKMKPLLSRNLLTLSWLTMFLLISGICSISI